MALLKRHGFITFYFLFLYYNSYIYLFMLIILWFKLIFVRTIWSRVYPPARMIALRLVIIKGELVWESLDCHKIVAVGTISLLFFIWQEIRILGDLHEPNTYSCNWFFFFVTFSWDEIKMKAIFMNYLLLQLLHFLMLSNTLQFSLMKFETV